MIFRKLLILFVVITVLAVLARPIAEIRIRSKERKEKENWRTELQDFDHLEKLFPSSQESSSAKKLKILTAALGVNLAARSDSPEYHPSRQAAMVFKQFQGTKGVLSTYVRTQFEDPGETIQPPPADLCNYIDEHSAQLSAVRNHLLGNDIPYWEMDLSRTEGFGGPDDIPLPNLLGILELQRLFMADFLLQRTRKNTVVASEDLMASWKLFLSIRERPELLCTLFSFMFMQIHLGVIRKFSDIRPEWESELLTTDPVPLLETAMQVEAWMIWRWASAGGPLKREGIHTWFTVPYMRNGTIEYLERLREEILQFRKINLCEFDPSLFDENDFVVPISKWNAIGRAAWSNHYNLWGRIVKIRLDQELTRRVLEARDKFPNQSDVWNKQENDAICPGSIWVYQTLPDHRRAISFRGRVSYKAAPVVDLALTHVF